MLGGSLFNMKKFLLSFLLSASCAFGAASTNTYSLLSSNETVALIAAAPFGSITNLEPHDTYGSNNATLVFNPLFDAFTNAWIIATDYGSISNNSYFRIAPNPGLTNLADIYLYALTNCIQLLPSGTFTIGFPTPKFELYSFGSGVNEKSWMELVTTNTLIYRINSYGGTNTLDFFVAKRTGVTLDYLSWTNASNYYFGEGLVIDQAGNLDAPTVSAGGTDLIGAIAGKANAFDSSSQIASVVTNETGTGFLVFNKDATHTNLTAYGLSVIGSMTADQLITPSLTATNIIRPWANTATLSGTNYTINVSGGNTSALVTNITGNVHVNVTNRLAGYIGDITLRVTSGGPHTVSCPTAYFGPTKSWSVTNGFFGHWEITEGTDSTNVNFVGRGW